LILSFQLVFNGRMKAKISYVDYHTLKGV
jgi:hypothetical protein